MTPAILQIYDDRSTGTTNPKGVENVNSLGR